MHREFRHGLEGGLSHKIDQIKQDMIPV